jgi:hypothetical protein
MWDERYSAEGYAYGTEPNDFLTERVGRLPSGLYAARPTLLRAMGSGLFRTRCVARVQGPWQAAPPQTMRGAARLGCFPYPGLLP